LPDLLIVDANFGMFKEDIETAREIAAIKTAHAHNWPKSVLAATAKNHKERTVEIVEMLGDTMPPTAAVQSTDPGVLDHIRRKNVSLDALVTLAQATAKHGGQTEAELILCLEGDSKTSHFKTVMDMLDANMTFIRMYQFMMLPGTQSASKTTREKYGFETRYRVLPRCFGTYRVRGEEFQFAEIEEIVVATNSMPHEDYQACRDLHLTVETFSNDSIFLELIAYLTRYGIIRSEFIREVHNRLIEEDSPLTHLYSQFREEEQKNLSDSLEKLESFVQEPGVIERYVNGEYGTNELYKYRALAVFQHIEPLHDIAFQTARSLLEQQGAYNEDVDNYLSELSEFSLMRKRDLLDIQAPDRRRFHFDFPQLMESKFTMDPFDAARPEGIELEVYHSEEQSELISGYITQYGTTLIGLGRLLIRANMNRLYRSARSLDPAGSTESEQPLRTNKRSHAHLIQ